MAELAHLAFEVDYVNWSAPKNVQLGFGSYKKDTLFGGGMGGAIATDSLWVHETMAGSVFARRIAEVLASRSTSIWPSGATPTGKPLSPFEVLDLLDEESGDAPAFETIRTAVELRQAAPSAKYAKRLSMSLRKFLSANEPGNRIEAAQHLLGDVDAALLVKAVFDAASGAADLPRWGMWRERAINTLGKLAKAGSVAAHDAIMLLSASDDWIRSFGPYVFDSDLGNDADKRYVDPTIFRREFAAQIRQ